jgi:hypothetical protein
MRRDRKSTFSAGCTHVSPPALFATILLALLMATPALTRFSHRCFLRGQISGRQGESSWGEELLKK